MDEKKAEKLEKEVIQILKWRKDVFSFIREAMTVYPAEPLDSLKGKEFEITNPVNGRKEKVMLFDKEGFLTHHNLQFYKKSYFKNQEKKDFFKQADEAPMITLDNGTDDERQIKLIYLTWQQTLELTAYQRAIDTFDKDSYNIKDRWISICSGHGIGKTSFSSIVILHFLFCFFHSQIGATANKDDQLKDILLKEFYIWKKRLPVAMGNNIEEQSDKIKVKGVKDWFLRARVSGKDNPESLAGLHGDHVLLYADEASGIWSKVFEVMQGALTGRNWIVLMTSNPTRSEGYFYDSHHEKRNKFTTLQFNSEESPIVSDSYVQGIIEDYGKDSDEYRIRVLGEFPSEDEMDDKGWMPLFANMRIHFEPEENQIVKSGVIGVDPSGQGKDKSEVTIRDNIYMKNVMSEPTSTPKDLARKVETIVRAYDCSTNDVGIDAFGVGAETVANIESKIGEVVTAILADKPREGTEHMFVSWKAEMAWKFRTWVANGGIIITNNQKIWIREMNKIKFKRNQQGKIQLMGKIEFKKLYGFSPDKFDSGLYTFFKDEPTYVPEKTKVEKETSEWAEFMAKVESMNTKNSSEDLSSM